MKTLLRNTLLVKTLLCLLAAVLIPASAARAQEVQKTLRVGQSDVYVFDRMTTVAVGSPGIADIVPLSSRRLLVNAKSLGQTTLFVSDHAGTHRLRLSVVPVPLDLRPLAAEVQSAIGLPGVTARALGDTVFLEGSVSSAVAWQRAAAIAAVYVLKVKNLLTVTPPDAGPAVSLAQTYAALLTPSLAPLGVAVQVVGDKTIALSGRYTRAAPGGETASSEWPAPQSRRKDGVKRKSAADAGDDAPDTETGPAEAAKGGVKSAPEAAASDPLDHLIQSLPPDLKVINLLNLGTGPVRQILVRAKIIDIGCTVSAEKPSSAPTVPGRNTTFAPSFWQITRSISVPTIIRFPAFGTASLVSTS